MASLGGGEIKPAIYACGPIAQGGRALKFIPARQSAAGMQDCGGICLELLKEYSYCTPKCLEDQWYSFLGVQNMSKPVFTPKSTTIHRVEYHEKEKALEIEFRSGNIYRYHDVPGRLWKVFQLYLECEGSAGSFFNEYIKGNFSFERAGRN
jgi:hypothetical protein